MICWKRKLYLHAFTHDLSKFSGSEFWAYANYFYKDKERYSHEFEKAWRHHYLNNPHHWQYWINKNGEPEEIPTKYLKQMIADWEAMALKFGDTAQQYYLNNYRNINLEYNTRLMLEYMLDLNYSMAHKYGHILEDFADMYNEEVYNNCFGFIRNKYGVDSYKVLTKDNNTKSL